MTMAQVPVARVTVRLGPCRTAGTTVEALKKGLEQYLHITKCCLVSKGSTE